MQFRARLRVKHLAALIIFKTLFLCSPSIVVANTRLAIGTFGLSPERRDGDLAELIATRLTATSELDLVERRELNKALNEATTSLSGLIQAKDAVRVGAMLRADLFLLGTSVPINGTNRLIVRLVDARSGAIRTINVIRDLPSLDTLAGHIAAFVTTEMQHPPQGQRDYLAVGVIQNLGVNNRFPDFPAQMRGSIAANLSDKVTVLERDVISFLANEVRMNLAGLTEPMGTNAQIQFGFWIVDGFYQSYEVAEPEVQIRLRVERVQGRATSSLLQGKPTEQFFAKICENVEQDLRQPDSVAGAPPPTRKGEIAALEARANQLVVYPPSYYGHTRKIWVQAPQNPDKVMNTLDEATRVYESILLLDPENVPARMRLAACLLFNAERYGGTKRDHLDERTARANDFYREVISTGDPEFAVEAQICLAESLGGLGGVEMLRRFSDETTDPQAKERLRAHASDLLFEVGKYLPFERIMPDVRAQIIDELKDLQQSTNEPFSVSFEKAMNACRFEPASRETIVNTLLPELLEKFPELKPYILLAAVSEQRKPDSPVVAQFLSSLRQCEEHPEMVQHPHSYFAHLSTTPEDEKAAHSGWYYDHVCERTLGNGLYSTVVAMTLARQRAAEKGFAPPLTNIGKTCLAKAYAGLNQWQAALDLYNTLPEVSPQVKNECRSHLRLDPQSEAVADAAWKGKDDTTKVEIAYDCMRRQQWLTAAAILDSMGHRTVRMRTKGDWGFWHAPVLPAVVANECRIKGGEPEVKDPMRFDLGETPYLQFTRGGPRVYSFEVEGNDIWIAIYSQIKRYSGPAPQVALKPAELHQFERNTLNIVTSICLSPDFIWAGTFDDGLLEFNRKTGETRHLTMKDGLFLNGLSSLYLQGQTLWIAYQNNAIGCLGTLDSRTHKLSALTPSLFPEVGATAQPPARQNGVDGTDQPPPLPIPCMTEGEPGEMWFGVPHKGLQIYSSSDRHWRTITESFTTFARNAYFSTMAADPAHGLVLAACAENPDYTLDNEKSKTGGLIIYDYREHKHFEMRLDQGLPSNNLTALAVDGRFAWIGGRGFVAVVDIPERKVLRVAYISANCINRIQLDKTYAWIGVISGGTDEYVEYSGSAWTGIYRVERSAVERVPYAVSKN